MQSWIVGKDMIPDRVIDSRIEVEGVAMRASEGLVYRQGNVVVEEDNGKILLMTQEAFDKTYGQPAEVTPESAPDRESVNAETTGVISVVIDMPAVAPEIAPDRELVDA